MKTSGLSTFFVCKGVYLLQMEVQGEWRGCVCLWVGGILWDVWWGRVLSRTPSGDPSSWRMFLQVNDFVLIIQILEGLRTLYECL